MLLLDFLNSFDLLIKVTFPTHRQSNTIDLIISGLHSNHLINFRQGRLFTDHHLLHCNLTTSTKVSHKKMISYHKLKNIGTTRFGYDVENNLTNVNLKSMSLQECGSRYNNLLLSLLAAYALKQRKEIIANWIIPWFNDNIRKGIQCHRKLEQIWRRNKSNKDGYLAFYHQYHLISNMLDNAERKYHRSLLSEHKFDFKQVFNICNGLLGRDKDLSLPPCDSNQALADWFNTFFTTKTQKIRNDLIDKNCDLINQGMYMANINVAFSNFKRVNEKSCRLLEEHPTKHMSLTLYPQHY